MKFIKIFFIALTFSLNFSILSYANQSVEEIIKWRKVIFSKNYQTAKSVSIAIKANDLDKAKGYLKEMSEISCEVLLMSLYVNTLLITLFSFVSYNCPGSLKTVASTSVRKNSMAVKTPIKTMSTAQARQPIYKSSINSHKKFSSFLEDLNNNI